MEANFVFEIILNTLYALLLGAGLVMMVQVIRLLQDLIVIVRSIRETTECVSNFFNVKLWTKTIKGWVSRKRHD